MCCVTNWGYFVYQLNGAQNTLIQPGKQTSLIKGTISSRSTGHGIGMLVLD